MTVRWVLLFLLGLVACSPSIRAEELACPPAQRLIADPDAEVKHGKGLLWKLTRGGGEPSYLFGTIHLSSADVLDVPPPVEQALESAESFVMEALFDAQAVEEFSGLMYDPGGAPLEELIGAAFFARTRELLSRYGVPPQAAQAMRPWAAFITLSQPADDLGIPLDLVLMQRAQAAGLRLYGLETLKEQAEVFGGMSEADQVALLREAVCQYDLVQEEIETLRRLYLARNLAGLKAMSEQYAEGDALTQKVMRQLITRRNERMARRVLPRLIEGNAFVAIGALHLPGEDGVLALLERQGYTVEAVY